MWPVVLISVLIVPARTTLPYDYYGMFLERLVSERVLAEMNGWTPSTTTTSTTSSTSTITAPSTTASYSPPVVRTVVTPNATVVSDELLPALKVAEFSGVSHVTSAAPADIVDYLDLRLNFKPSQHAGLLFYWQDAGRYLAVYMERGYVNGDLAIAHKGYFWTEFCVLKSEAPVVLHQWHRAEIWRTGKGILMKVDRQSWVESQLISIRGQLTKPGTIYLGGYDGVLPHHLSVIAGFHGCMKKLRLNGRSIALRPEHGANIRECGTDPCATAGCPRACTSTNDDFTCLCEWPKYGRTCEHGERITGESLKLEINLKLGNVTDNTSSSSKNQLVMFAGESGVTADFFRLVITQDRTVQVMMNLGSGLVTLTHPTQLIPERWARVEVVRQKRQLTLSVNDATPITTVAPGDSEQLNVYKGLFVGGEKHLKYPPNSHDPSKSPFGPNYEDILFGALRP
ncbi:unnamed protein product [Nippostrongylus brasiliensis]|uniref:LAM_G_DOMAIN domain-containing protein n=1 Tax=Nippostrongylus brasiliensis TaxID=27835 RepID=A0A158QXB0_NIPBR|nr:unnamed protein product [Nippostrongylus brasiliensis]